MKIAASMSMAGLLGAATCGLVPDRKSDPPTQQGKAAQQSQIQLSAIKAAAPGSVGGTSAVAASATGAPLAFPGALGYGAASAGGRGGSIVQVTTLADSGPGSLRACITTEGPRVCVFRVAGVIRWTTPPPLIKSPNITIAGETAPGDGITLAHNGGSLGTTPLLIKNSANVVIRHIRVRPDMVGSNRAANDAITIENSRNVILDHVSGSWALDENINGHRQNDNITISWSIFAEGIAPHDKCALLGSDPTGPQRMTFVGNLCASHGDRNPDLNFTPRSCIDIVNNVFYNASSQFAEIWESYGGTSANIAGNVFRAGPVTRSSTIGIDRQTIGSTGSAVVWIAGNQFDGSFVQLASALSPILATQPVCPLSVTPVAASAAYATVLAGAGSFPRDSFDKRIVGDVQALRGAIASAPGPMPVLQGGTPYPDRDKDGMSDSWEAANGTQMSVADAWGDANRDGLSNLEAFLNYAHMRRMQALPVL